MRSLLLGLLTSVLTLAVCLLLLEVALRFLPVNTGLHTQPVNEEATLRHFKPDQEYVWSKGWNFSIVNRGRVNNVGFVNNQAYDAGATSPLIAVIGDSYIEAIMVPYTETLHGRLAAELAGRARVYSFAASGAPLSQYLAWADHARRTYQPQAMVFLVVGNDFDESLAHFKTGAGFHHYVEDASGALQLKRFDYEPSPLRWLVRASALGRYLYINLKAGQAVQRLKGMFHDRPQPMQFFGNTSAEASPERVTYSDAAIRAFFRDLPAYSGLPADRVLFILDGIRETIYEPKLHDAAQAGYFAEMRRRFMGIASAEGYAVLDMDPIFRDRYRALGRRFEFANDRHWSGYGHGVATEALRMHPTFAGWVRADPD